MIDETKIYSGYEFLQIFQNRFATVYFNAELHLAICVADVEYIPISNFKEIFHSITEQLEFLEIKHLIFDKTALRTFHQPSMEWYFAVWKQTVKLKGLVNHYKILPELDWFEKAVQAGRHEIFKKYNQSILEGLTVTYVKTVEEAIENCKQLEVS